MPEALGATPVEAVADALTVGSGAVAVGSGAVADVGVVTLATGFVGGALFDAVAWVPAPELALEAEALAVALPAVVAAGPLTDAEAALVALDVG